MINVKPSRFVANFIYVGGKPFQGENGFSEWCYLKDIYDDGSKFMVLKSSRQCAKSTTLGNKILMYCSIIPGFLSLYVAPTDVQTTTFSNDRLTNVIEQSPLLSKLTSKKLTNNVSEKRFLNYSSVRLRTGFVRPEKTRVRGIAARQISIDELQDMTVDHIPVILECAATFPLNKIITFAGTPLTYDNVIEVYWDKFSSMNEWMVKCGCGKWNGTTIKNIGETGYICETCGKLLDIKSGQWITGRKDAKYAGYHINQLMTPYTAKSWDEFVDKHRGYPLNKFLNEVMGESFDSGIKPLTRKQMLACCKNDKHFIHNPPPQMNNRLTVAGIDWGTGDKSYTVMVVLTFNKNFDYDILYARRFEGADAEQDVMLTEIKKMLNRFAINLIGADWGFGAYYNFDLAKEFGPQKVIPIYYSDSSKDKLMYDNKAKRITANKTMVLEDVFQLFKREQIILPSSKEWMEPYGEDILNEYVEENHKTTRLRYSHRPDTTDDSLHALTYAIIASQYLRPRKDLFFPSDTFGNL